MQYENWPDELLQCRLKHWQTDLTVTATQAMHLTAAHIKIIPTATAVLENVDAVSLLSFPHITQRAMAFLAVASPLSPA
jgi:hypothetical protein